VNKDALGRWQRMLARDDLARSRSGNMCPECWRLFRSFVGRRPHENPLELGHRNITRALRFGLVLGLTIVSVVSLSAEPAAAQAFSRALY
jgi:hypothetical protein